MAAIKKIVMDARRCIIVTDKEDKQWIGDGKRFYAVDEDIRFERDTVLTILDIEKDKRSKIPVFQERSVDPRFSIYADEEENERLTPRMAVMYGGELFMVFTTERREVFAIEHAALKPIADMGRDYTLRRREVFGEEMRPAIAVATDLFVNALLTPAPTKVTAAIVAEMGFVSQNEAKGYGDEDEDLIEGTEEAE